MALFKTNLRHAKDDNTSKKKLIIALIAIGIALIVTAIIMTIIFTDGNDEVNTETQFIEDEVITVEDDEIITINDPLLGEIYLDAVEGMAKSTYVRDNFVLDDKGLMTYTIEGKPASCMGVDLSEFQGTVDFEKLKEQGISFVILRIGGRYYSESGKMYTDTNFHQYYKAATDAGLDVGGYFFSQAKNAQEAKEEADYVMDNIRGMEFKYPIAFDWELIEGDTARTENVKGEKLTDAAIAFCETISANGYKPIIYTNTHLMYYMYDLERLKDYEFWVADYEDKPSIYYYFTMWQYTKEGQLEGISGDVDLNICLKNY